MTAHALVEERQHCFDAGMNDHVTKPIDPDVLLATLLRWAKPSLLPATGGEAIPAKRVEELTLPRIEGVDLEDGLRRVVGNKRLYRDLLLQFASKQADAPAQVSTAIERHGASGIGTPASRNMALRPECALKFLAIRFKPFDGPCKRSCRSDNRRKP